MPNPSLTRQRKQEEKKRYRERRFSRREKNSFQHKFRDWREQMDSELFFHNEYISDRFDAFVRQSILDQERIRIYHAD